MASETKFKETEIGMIPKEWEVKELGKLTTKITTGSTPPSDVREYVENGVNFIRSQNVFDFFIDKSNIVKVNKESISYIKNSQVEENDVLLNITGDGITFLRSCTSPKDILPAYTNQSIAVIKPDKSLDGKFLSYYFSLPDVKKYMEGYNAGSARRTLAAKHVNKFLVPLPSKKEQTKIATIISSLNDKIDLSNQMNKTLEQIAQTLFKHWFIDFEFPDENGNPYKSSGGRMVDSELGEIPEGWKIKKLSDICSKVIDGTHDSPKPVEEGFYLVTGKHLSNGFIDFSQCYKISAEDHKKVISRSEPEKGDILFSNIGTLGSTVLVDQNFEFSIKNIALFKPLENFYSRYLYLHFSSTQTQKLLIQKATGTTQTFFSLKFLRNLELLVPLKHTVSQFDEIVQPIFEMRSLANQANQNLSNLRDSLLPKLMSGKIRVEC